MARGRESAGRRIGDLRGRGRGRAVRAARVGWRERHEAVVNLAVLRNFAAGDRPRQNPDGCLAGDGTWCHAMYDMKFSALTIRLDPKLSRQLAQVAKRTGKSRSEVVRDAVQRQLALARFQDLRRRVMPLAEAQGYLTDEDVLRDLS